MDLSSEAHIKHIKPYRWCVFVIDSCEILFTFGIFLSASMVFYIVFYSCYHLYCETRMKRFAVTKENSINPRL